MSKTMSPTKMVREIKKRLDQSENPETSDWDRYVALDETIYYIFRLYKQAEERLPRIAEKEVARA